MANFPVQGQKPWGAVLKAYIDDLVAGRLPADAVVPDANLPARLSAANLSTSQQAAIDAAVASLPAEWQASIDTAIANLRNGAPAAMDTLKELADALASDETAAGALTTLVTAIRNLTDPTHSAALAAAYYGKAAPSYAGVRTRPFDPMLNIYGSLTARAAVRRARGSLLGSARTSLVPVTLIGDSATSGWKAGAIGSDDYATMLVSRLRAAGYPVTGGWVFPGNGQTPGDARWTFGGANSWQGRTTTTNNYIWSSVAGNTATFSSTSVGTIVEVGLVTTVAGQSVTWSLDGGAQTGTFNLTANVLNTLSIPGLSLGTHTIAITTASTATNTIWLCGARVREATGLSITNAGIFGCHTDDWTPTGGSGTIINPFNLATGLGGQPKLAIIQLGANDMLHAGHTLAAAKANINTLVGALKAAGTTVVQRAYQRPSAAGLATAAAGSPVAGGATWDQFVSALYDTADTNDTVLLDNTALLGDSETLESGGLVYSDHLHMLTPGQAAVAHADYQALQAI